MTAASPEPAGSVLLVDDEPAFQRLGAAFLKARGFRVTVAGDADAALARFREDRPDVVVLDLALPPHLAPEAGLALIPAFAPAPVIVLTGHADHAVALDATASGAWDFLAKPADPELLAFAVGRAAVKARLDAELRALRGREGGEEMGLVGRSPAIERLRADIRRLGPTDVSVLVLGPTGSGKELVARALHACSRRATGPIVPVHCGALSAELLESELFGHLKGSFTGAFRDANGVLETADRGTLFLDEVGEMPLAMQVKLLRFLQEGTFVPVGGRVQKRADVRVVAATHRDLDAMLRDGTFREDLFYRLRGVVLRVPGLAERREDVALLAARFLRRRHGPGQGRARLSPEAAAFLAGRDWSGNVRELRTVVETAAALAADDAIDEGALRFACGEDRVLTPEPAGRQTLEEAVSALEERMLSHALDEANGNQSEAARRLGLSRGGLIKKLGRLRGGRLP